jgi:hypothetical protein
MAITLAPTVQGDCCSSSGDSRPLIHPIETIRTRRRLSAHISGIVVQGQQSSAVILDHYISSQGQQSSAQTRVRWQGNDRNSDAEEAATEEPTQAPVEISPVTNITEAVENARTRLMAEGLA